METLFTDPKKLININTRCANDSTLFTSSTQLLDCSSLRPASTS